MFCSVKESDWRCEIWILFYLVIFLLFNTLTFWPRVYNEGHSDFAEAIVWLLPLSYTHFNLCNVRDLNIKTFLTILVSALLFAVVSESISGQVAITPDSIRNWSPSYVALVICSCVVVLTLFGYHLWIAYHHIDFKRYCLHLFGSIALIMTLVFSLDIKFHIHHYVWSGYLACFARFPKNRMSVMNRNILIGIFIQGIAAYGPDPIFYWKDSSQNTKQLHVTDNI